MTLEITEVRVVKQDNGKLKGFASITLGGVFVVHGFRLVEGQNGVFVGMPSNKVGDEFKDTAYPITKEFKEYLSEKVLEAYNKAE